MRQKKIPLNLQYFAGMAENGASGTDEQQSQKAGSEAGNAGTAGTEAAGGGQDNAKDDSGKTGGKTKEEAGEQEKGREDISALVQEELRKASMNPEEREAYEKQQKEKRLAEREDAISLRERRADAKELLADNGLPAEFQDMVMGKDRAATEANVKSFKSRFDEAVQARVEARLSGRTPSGTAGVTGGSEKDALLAQVEGYL
jgi:hypothetical protein